LLTFDRESEDIQNIDMLLNRAAEMIQKNLMTTMVRIGALDAGNMSLSTRALHTIRPFDRAEVEKVNLSSKTTFWHHLAAREQRPLLISRENGETHLSKSECEALVFDGVQTALIVPITINGLTFGLITLGEERKWQRYSYDAAAINFVRELAARVAMAIKLLKFSQALISGRATAREAVNADGKRGLLDRLKSPTSTMRGSLELLKRGETLDAERSRRLVSMMDESTEEIMAVLTDGE
jgi:transcriptional regulator with GAF, ATPase, and Fis domain